MYRWGTSGVSEASGGTVDDTSGTDWGVAGGIGAQMRLPTSPVGFFAEGMYNNVFTEGSSTNFFNARVGVNFYVNMTQ
jgi:hypothetical protein